MPHAPRRLAAVAGTALAGALMAFPAAAGAVAPAAARGGPQPFFDVRAAAVDRGGAPGARPPRTLSARDRAAQRRLVRGLGRQAVLDLDPITATPRVLGRLNGALTSASAGDAADIALGYVRANAGALGLTAGDLSSLTLADRYKVSGVTHLRWRQEYRGIPAFDNELRATVDADGRLINVLGAPRHALSVPSATPRLTAAEAIAALARNVGGTRIARVTSGPSGARAVTRFNTGDSARLVLFGDVRAVRLAWRVTYDAGPAAWYDAVVDATTGRLLRRANLVKAINALVFKHYPGAPSGGTQVTETLDRYLSDTTRLFGNFAHAWSDINDAPPPGAPTEAPDPTEEVPPAPYPFVNFPIGALGACLPVALCSWNHTVANSWETNRRQNAVQAFWYVNHFHDHLAAPPIDFTAASGNFEGPDRVLVESDDGANTAGGLPDGDHVDNANMATPSDGQSPRMQMYLFKRDDTPPGPPVESPFRDVNGGDDAAIVYHEYTHGLSNRLVVDADGGGALNSPQSGAMGEAWSDWYAKDLLNNEGRQPDTAAPGEVDMGIYVDSEPHRIRNQALDCPVGADAAVCPGAGDAGPGGFTYGDFGKLGRGPEVHDDGEIWGETLWDLRGALGSEVSEAIITEGMRLAPPEPSFLDARNAILQADQALFGGVHVNGANGIWAVFARRGMGFFAGAEDGSDIAPVEDFGVPPAAGGPTGVITGRVIDSVTGLPLLGVRVGIGGLDTPPSSFVATTGANGEYAMSVPVGTYPLVTIRGIGYDRFTARTVQVPAGGARRVDAVLRRDWAAISGGAEVTATNDDAFADFGCGVEAAFDQSLGAGWSAFTPESSGAFGIPNPHPGQPPTATVELPQAIDVSSFGIDPSNTCGDDPASATKDIRVETSTDGVTFTTALAHTFSDADRGRLNLLAPTAAGTNVRFVRVTMLTRLDPSNGTGVDFVDLSELEVLGAATGNAPPSGTLVATPSAVTAGDAVTLDASAFRDPDSAISGFDWDVDGDGVFEQHTTASSIRPVYGTPGTFRPSVRAIDFRGGGGVVASATVTVSARASTPTPGGGNAPVQAGSRPTARISASRLRGRALFTLGCSSACRATATMTVTRATARRARLRSTRIARVTRRLSAAGRRTFRLTVSRTTLRRMRNRGLRTVTATVAVVVRDARGQTRTVRRAVRVRVR
jgi:extracellular elastinolytic metalloproteinase